MTQVQKLNFIKMSAFVVFLLLVGSLNPLGCIAQDDYVTVLEKGTVLEVVDEEKIEVEGLDEDQVYQKLEVKIDSGEKEGDEVIIEIGGEYQANIISYKEGDKVVVSISKGPDDTFFYYVTNYQRTGNLAFLFILFIAVAVLIGGVSGMKSILGLAVSMLVVFVFIIPYILQGNNPIVVSTIASVFLVPVTFYLSHGLKKSTTIAVIATLFSVLATGIMASVFIKGTHITGTGLEDAFFLQTTSDIPINLPNLLIAGIIISSLGILDDVTVSQVYFVEKIFEKDRKLKLTDLYKESMSLGKNHISSMINTLVLTYTGSSISLLLLFSVSEVGMHNLLNLEVVALEIVRTLVSSIVLMLSIPLTTFFAACSKVRNS